MQLDLLNSFKKIRNITILVLPCVHLYAGIGDYRPIYDSQTQNSITNNAIVKSVSSATGSSGKAVLDGLNNVNNIKNTISSFDGKKITDAIFSGLGMSDDFFMQPIKIPGLAGLNLECDLPDKGSGRKLDICQDIGGGLEDQMIGGINKIFETLTKGVSIGGCKVSVETRKICKTDMLQDSCAAIKSAGNDITKGVKNAAGELIDPIVKLTPVQAVVSSVEEMARFGEDLVKDYMKDQVDSNSCLAILPSERRKRAPIGNKGKTVDDVYRENFNADNILKVGVQRAGASSFYSTLLYTWKECVLLNPDNPEVCDAKNFKLPETYEDIQGEVDKTRLLMSDGIEKSKTFEDSLLLANNYISKCSNGEAQSDCEERIYKEGYTVINSEGQEEKVIPAEAKSRKYEDIAKSTSAYASLIKAIKVGNKGSNTGFMTEQVIQKMPIEKRIEARNSALLGMKEQAMLDYFIDKTLQHKKEIVDIEHNLVKIAASQFNSEEAMARVNSIITSFEQSAVQK